MINLKIFKGEKDEAEIVFVQVDDGKKEKLTFDIIKKISVNLLERTISGEDNAYTIEISDSSLLLYKEIVAKVFDSVIKDDELKSLYEETVKTADTTKSENKNP